MPSLFEITLNLIQNRPAYLELKKIADDTELNYSWVCMFHQGRITNPTYNKLQKLHDYLLSKKQTA